MLILRGIYENGRIRLLDEVNLTEGQQVKVTVLEEEISVEEADRRLREAGILAEVDPPPDDAIELTPEEREIIARKLAGDGSKTLLDWVHEERGEY